MISGFFGQTQSNFCNFIDMKDLKNILRPPTKFNNLDQIILRDYLALERTKLANERTLMSYVRASIYLVLAGIAFLRLEDFEGVKWLGYTAIALSIMLLIFGLLRFFRFISRLKKYYPSTEEINND